MLAGEGALGADTRAEEFVGLNLRWNVASLGADFGLFLTGLSFASQSTILPAFAAHLGAPNVVIGAIPALMTLGWLLPSLFAAGHTESLARKLPFIMRWTLWERVPYLALAGVAFLLADRAPDLALGLLLLLLLLATGIGGLLMPAWLDLVGRVIPLGIRGRFFAGATVLGNVGGLLGSLGTAWVLGTVAPPRSYGLCFLAASLALALSYLALGQVREPPGPPPAPAVPLRAYLRRIPDVLRRDPNLVWFLVARWAGVLGAAGAGFFTVHALRAHHASDWHVGLFTAALLAGQIAGGLVLGWLADRVGHKPGLVAGAGAMAVAELLAVTAPSLALYLAVFVLAGVNHAALHVSGHSILLEFAPAPAERPTYVGLASTGIAPVAFLSPLVAGAAADRAGLIVVFVAAGAVALAATALMLFRVRDPRRASAV